jgi:hypothetical protein
MLQDSVKRSWRLGGFPTISRQFVTAAAGLKQTLLKNRICGVLSTCRLRLSAARRLTISRKQRFQIFFSQPSEITRPRQIKIWKKVGKRLGG